MRYIALLALLASFAVHANGPVTPIGGRNAQGGVINGAIDTDGNFGTYSPCSDKENGACVVEQGQFDYETVAVSQTDQVCGVTGAAGDFLHEVVVVVTTSGANGIASIKDGGGSAISIVPASAPIGVYPIPFNIVSTSGAWKVTTGSAATAICIGRFTP